MQGCTKSCHPQGTICYDVSNKEVLPTGHQYYCRANAPMRKMNCNRLKWTDEDGTSKDTHGLCRAPCRRLEITGSTCNECINTHWAFPECKGIDLKKSGIEEKQGLITTVSYCLFVLCFQTFSRFLECFCNPLGVGDPFTSRLCDKDTGECNCKSSKISGIHCDRCAEGYEGEFPDC